MGATSNGKPGHGQVWLTEYVCTRCRERLTHVELSVDDDDDAQGLPLMMGLMGCPDCGGKLSKVGESRG